MASDHETVHVLIGSYLSRTAAMEDYDTARSCGAHLHGAVVVSRDLTGRLDVEQSDHMIGEGARRFGRLGLISGLIVFPLVPVTTAFGAAAGAVVGEGMHLLTERRIQHQAASMIPLGCAGLILAYPGTSAVSVEAAVKRPIRRVVSTATGHHLQALRAAVADAQQQMTEVANDQQAASRA